MPSKFRIPSWEPWRSVPIARLSQPTPLSLSLLPSLPPASNHIFHPIASHPSRTPKCTCCTAQAPANATAMHSANPSLSLQLHTDPSPDVLSWLWPEPPPSPTLPITTSTTSTAHNNTTTASTTTTTATTPPTMAGLYAHHPSSSSSFVVGSPVGTTILTSAAAPHTKDHLSFANNGLSSYASTTTTAAATTASAFGHHNHFTSSTSTLTTTVSNSSSHITMSNLSTLNSNTPSLSSVNDRNALKYIPSNQDPHPGTLVTHSGREASPIGSPTNRKHSVFSTSSANTGSGRSSFRYVNGRRYHADESVLYLLPCDLPELNRQTLKHHLYKEVFGGIYLAEFPDNKIPSRVLDIGCGTGIWIADMHDHFAARGRGDVHFVGMDIVPVFQPMTGVDFAFCQHDALRFPYPFKDKEFDYIFVRDLTLGMPDTAVQSEFIAECMRLLRDGGVYEVQCSMFTSPVHRYTGWRRSVILTCRVYSRPLHPLPPRHQSPLQSPLLRLHHHPHNLLHHPTPKPVPNRLQRPSLPRPNRTLPLPHPLHPRRCKPPHGRVSHESPHNPTRTPVRRDVVGKRLV